MTPRDRPRRYWLALAIAGMTLILLAASAFTLATLPPRTIVMATGAEGGANYELGLRYQEILAQSGGGELHYVPNDIINLTAKQMSAVTVGQGADLTWPGLLRKLDRIDSSFRE